MAIFKKKRLIDKARAVFAAAGIAGLALPFAAGAESLSERVDSLYNTLDYLEDKVRSTLMSGGSSPISFSGEARVKAQYHNLGFDAPGWMRADRSYMASGWEGNENIFRLGMVARPGRNTVLWSKIGFQHTLTGNRYYAPGNFTGYPDGFVPYQYRHDKAQNSITIHEDMSAGIAVRTLPASFWVRLGNTMWTEASPLTVWKAQPRTFAWEYLPFEVEQPIARYYEYNIAKGEKAGRAAWNKRPFNGINVESINLPLDLYANFIYGTFERYDNFEREYFDFGGDLGYADGAQGAFPMKGHGIGDSYRHVIHGRLAKDKLFGGMTLGLNYVGIDYNDDAMFSNKGDAYLLLREFRGYDSIFVKEPKVFSVDMRGPINDKFSIHADIALGIMDTVWYVDTSTARRESNAYAQRSGNPEVYNTRRVSSADPTFAAYTKLNYSGIVEADLAYVGKDFYSPFSFAVPIDAFYPFRSNMVGAGKFIARGEGSPYTQNMAGANLTLTLPDKYIGYGHARLIYGQHFNVEEGRDLLFFPYRLHGADMFSFFHSSFNRWGNSVVDNSVKAGGKSYVPRLGDESFVHMASYNTNINVQPVVGPGGGGLRSDFLSMYEGFVPYASARDAWLNFMAKHSINNFTATANPNVSSNLSSITNHSLYYVVEGGEGENVQSDTLRTNTSWVPVSKKYTFNLELDAAKDIGSLIGYSKDLFIGGYVGINGITSEPSALTFGADDKNTLLWSCYLRLEPAIALHKNFYLLGLFGFETWRSDKSWMMVNRAMTANNGFVYYGIPLHPSTSSTSSGRLVSAEGNAVPPSIAQPDGRVTPDNFIKVPIHTRDFAYGLGFDWDILERVGLHFRAKWMTHEDKALNDYYDDLKKEWARMNDERVESGEEPYNFPKITGAYKNDWKTPVFSLELKTWF